MENKILTLSQDIAILFDTTIKNISTENAIPIIDILQSYKGPIKETGMTIDTNSFNVIINILLKCPFYQTGQLILALRNPNAVEISNTDYNPEMLSSDYKHDNENSGAYEVASKASVLDLIQNAREDESEPAMELPKQFELLKS